MVDMSWYSAIDSRPHIPSTKEIWEICPRCRTYTLKADWCVTGYVCPSCGYHGRMPVKKRIELLIDAGTFIELFTDVSYSDHLDFSDGSESYKAKVEKAIRKTGRNEAVTFGRGELYGRQVLLGVFDFTFMGGSIGTGTGERIVRACDEAIKRRTPLIICNASGGARMQEGILSLMSIAKIAAAIGRVKEATVPYISIITDPTMGGCSISTASLGDIVIAEPGVLYGFAGRRVIENTIRQKLPPDFQTAEYMLAHGFIDKIVERKNMKRVVSKLLGYFCG